MKILNFTKNTKQRMILISRSIFTLALVLTLSVVSTAAENDDCSMICSGDLNAQVDKETCETTISFYDLLPKPCYTWGYKVEILTLNNYPVEEGKNSVTVSLVGKYIYKVTHEVDEKDVSCWGYITFEDKEGPVKALRRLREPNTEVCGVPDTPDPSGTTDLRTEIVSCVVKDKFDEKGLEPWFDVLDIYDFKDCSGVKEVWSFTEGEDLCKREHPLPIDFETELNNCQSDIPNGWEACYMYRRGWFASDKTGRLSDTCYQYVTVIRPRARLIRIDDNIIAECGDDEAEVLANSYPYFYDLSNSRFRTYTCPDGQGAKIEISPSSHFCKYSATVHYDERTALCGTDGSKVFKLVGHWTVIDWCTGDPIVGNNGRDLFNKFTSQLEVWDSKDPIFKSAAKPSIKSSLFDCTADITVGGARFADCVGVESVETIVEYIVDAYDPHLSRLERVSSPTNGITLKDVPLNTQINVTYIAKDSCRNVGKGYDEIYVDDDRAPVCIANDELNVSMVRLDAYNADSLGARVYGEDIDDTSRDNCFPVILEVRRADQAQVSNDPDTLWAEYVEFSKKDLTDGGCKGSYKVELRVTEDRGHYNTGKPLSSTCWGTVVIEDKNAPIIHIGDDKVALCTELRPEFDVPDIAGCYDGVDMAIDTLIDNECAYKVILKYRKTWRPYTFHQDAKEYFESIAQTITIKNVHDSKFTFPIDLKVDCSEDEIPEPAKIQDILDEQGCANWLMQVEDREFETNDLDACRKILRQYTFINWCTWDPSNTELAVVRRPDAGVWTEDDQIVIHYRDADCDYKNDIDDYDDGDAYDIEESEFGYKHDGAWVQIDNGDRVNGQITFNHTDEIRGRRTTSIDAYKYGYFAYTQVIKVQDNEDPVSQDPIVKITCDPLNTDCTFPAKVEIILGGTDNCSEVSYESYIQPFQEGPLVLDHYGVLEGNVITGYYPVGTHNLIIKTSDACNNFVQDTIKLVIGEECKKPTPICHATFTAAMENGSVTVWATDVESGSSYDNCTDYDNLDFRIEFLATIKDGYSIDLQDLVSSTAPESKEVTLTCDNIGHSKLALWVIDTSGNEQYCIVPVIVVDNSGICQTGEATITGKIVNESDEDIDQVTVKVDRSGMSQLAQIFNGLFDFAAIPMHHDVTITPEKDHGYLNGVSTSDLVLLQRHILGVNELNSPYKIIAADANGDDNVDTRDMLHLSRLILGVYDELPNTTSWRFVKKDYVFTTPKEPWGFPEDSDYQHIESDIDADFIGMKIGDISGNAIPSNLLGDESVTASRTIAFVTDNSVLNAGAEHTITFDAHDMKDVSGYQFTIELDPNIVLNGITYGPESKLTDANFGLSMIDKHLITVSWSNVEALNFKDGTPLFNLNIGSSIDTDVQKAFRISSAFTPAEAYDNDLARLDVVMKIRTSDTAFELYQNVPNPVNDATTIAFNIPEAGLAVLKIMDVSGRTIHMISGDYSKGYNEVTIDRNDLGSAGVLYYQLEANGLSASKKMIIID